MEDKAKIQEEIKIQGEVVRKLKSEKASKEQVSAQKVKWYWMVMQVVKMQWTWACPFWHLTLRAASYLPALHDGEVNSYRIDKLTGKFRKSTSVEGSASVYCGLR